MKELIINADDLGADEGRNAGILEAVRAGVVKSVSLLANGPATDEAIKAIHEGKYEEVSIGLHLNLSEGKSISADLRLLAGNDGAFPGKAAAQRLLLQENIPELEKEVFREVEAQIGLLLKAGIPLIHLDGHQHLHIFPAVRKAAIGAAKKYGIPWIRIAHEPCPVSEEEQIPEDLKSEAKGFSDLSAGAFPLLAGTGIRAADHFCGLYLKGRLSSHILEKYLVGLPEGLTELMVHPGRVPAGPDASPFRGFSTIDREKERDALLSPSFRRAVLQNGVTLISFREALP
jgi:chitin disaccharide deacetylase